MVDEVKNISAKRMRSQLLGTTDIVTALDLAPPTKRCMHWKKTRGIEKLFALPGRPLLARSLFRVTEGSIFLFWMTILININLIPFLKMSY